MTELSEATKQKIIRGVERLVYLAAEIADDLDTGISPDMLLIDAYSQLTVLRIKHLDRTQQKKHITDLAGLLEAQLQSGLLLPPLN